MGRGKSGSTTNKSSKAGKKGEKETVKENKHTQEEFENTIQDVVNDTERWREGTKVYIHKAYNNYIKKYGYISREDFNQKILKANMNGKITLSRADLVGAMNQDDIKAARVLDRNTEKHFIRATN